MLLEVVERLKVAFDSIIGLKFNQPYWVEITTKKPFCIYYFGPFDSYIEAKSMQGGYVEDLVAEKATGISVEIKRCMPTKLTITEEE